MSAERVHASGHKVIDLRCRPAYLHDFFGATPGSAGADTVRWPNRRVGTVGHDAHFSLLCGRGQAVQAGLSGASHH